MSVHEDGCVSAPEQHRPPLYACAAGAVLHAHAGDTLEPAVLLHTFLPPGAGDRLHAPDARVDVHADGPGAATVTVRVLADGQSLSWQLPLAPLVAALPGQSGPDGRMVLLAVMDSEPAPGFWGEAVDCEQLAAELQLPVTDLHDALRGRLTPWLAEDVDLLLHDDAHDHAADRSPAQTLASAVLAHYHHQLDAQQWTGRLVRGLEFGPESFQLELGGLLSAALATAVRAAGPAGVADVVAQTGPFEGEVLRLLTELPGALQAQHGTGEADRVIEVLLGGPDLEETARAAVSVVARLARAAFGPDLDDQQVLHRLEMLDDDGLARLAELWVQLAEAAAARPEGDEDAAARIVAGLRAAGGPGRRWLRDTAGALSVLTREVAGRGAAKLAPALDTLRPLLADPPPAEEPQPAGVQACVSLARFVRSRAGLGPGVWLAVPVTSAAEAVCARLAAGADQTLVLDLLAELLESDVEGPDLLDAFVCATSQLLSQLEPGPTEDRAVQVAEVLAAVPAGARGARWLLVTCLRQAHAHDAAAPDLGVHLLGEPEVDADRLAQRAGVGGMLSAGLTCLDALAATFGDAADLPREELLQVVLPAALAEHELLREPA